MALPDSCVWILYKLVSLYNAVAIWLLSHLQPKKRSSHGVRIYRVLRRDPLLRRRNPHFIAIFTGFGSVEEVHDRTVSLYTLMDNDAWFVKADGGIDVTDMKIGSITVMNQVAYAKNLISVPLALFHRMAEKMPIPSCPTTCISHTGRCGSTLLARMLAQITDIRVVCDFLALKQLSQIADSIAVGGGQWSDHPTFSKNLIATMKWISHQAVLDKPYQAVVLKLGSYCINLVEPIHLLLPWVRHVYMYRNGLNTVTSKMKITFRGICDPDNADEKEALEATMKSDKNLGTESFNFLIEASCMQWATNVKHFLKYRDSGMNIKSIKYEDLLSQPKNAIVSLLVYICLDRKDVFKQTNKLTGTPSKSSKVVDEATDSFPSNYYQSDRQTSPVHLISSFDIEPALSALREDSQAGLVISREALRRYATLPALEFTPEKRAACDKICDKVGVPKLDQDIALPGNILLGL